MKIVKFYAENIKRLVAVEITPEGNVIKITGKNGAGKSSVLDAIFWALTGTKKIQGKPIREGQDKAVIRLELAGGERKLSVERRFTEKGTTLHVKTEEGAKYGNPQEILNDLIGAITFDPLEFTRLDSKKQYHVLRGLMKMEIDIDALEDLNTRDYNERTAINREAKGLEGAISMFNIPENTPDEAVDVAELSAQMQENNIAEALVDKITERVADTKEIISSARDSVVHYDQELENAKKHFVESEENLVKHQKALENAKEVAKENNASEIQEKINSANETNQHVFQKKELKTKEDSLLGKQGESEEYSSVIERRKKEISDAIEAAELPLKGLSISEGGVVFNGIPFDQISSAEQIKVSVSIAMAMNPKLKVIRVKDGSLLDSDSLKILEDMATENDYQIWLESVSSEGDVGIVIEDGMIKGQAQNENKEPEAEQPKSAQGSMI